jgi:hypothetical protein
MNIETVPAKSIPTVIGTNAMRAANRVRQHVLGQRDERPRLERRADVGVEDVPAAALVQLAVCAGQELVKQRGGLRRDQRVVFHDVQVRVRIAVRGGNPLVAQPQTQRGGRQQRRRERRRRRRLLRGDTVHGGETLVPVTKPRRVEHLFDLRAAGGVAIEVDVPAAVGCHAAGIVEHFTARCSGGARGARTGKKEAAATRWLPLALDREGDPLFRRWSCSRGDGRGARGWRC